MLIAEEKIMELDSVFEEVVARGLINDEQPSLVGHLTSSEQRCKKRGA